jgi:hypothetical protein
MIKKIRLVLAFMILSISLYLIVWGYSPNPRETRERIIPPAELQLPTPSSLHFTPEPVA